MRAAHAAGVGQAADGAAQLSGEHPSRSAAWNTRLFAAALPDGAAQLADGSAQLSDGVGQHVDGINQIVDPAIDSLPSPAAVDRPVICDQEAWTRRSRRCGRRRRRCRPVGGPQ